MPTEFHQPVNPIRVWTKTEKHRISHTVFAIAISSGEHVEYLTINGQFVPAKLITYAEVLLNGQWTALDALEMRTPAT